MVSQPEQDIDYMTCFRPPLWRMSAVQAGVLLAAFSCPAGWAQDSPTTVGLHVATYHDNGAYENFNPGVYVVHKSWAAGFYNNSTRQTTVYGGYSWRWSAPPVAGLDMVSLTAALATGYPNKIDGTDISLIVIPSARFRVSEKMAVRLSLLPFVRRYHPATSVHFSIERSF